MRTTIIIFLGLMVGIALGYFIQDTPNNKILETTHQQGRPTGPVNRVGTIDAIQHEDNFLILTHLSDYEPDVVYKTKIYFNNKTIFNEGLLFGDSTDIFSFWMYAPLINSNNIQPGTLVRIKSISNKGRFEALSITTWSQTKYSIKDIDSLAERDIDTTSAGGSITGTIDSINYVDDELILKYRNHYTNQSTLRKVKIRFNKDTVIERSTTFKKNNAVYFQRVNIDENATISKVAKRDVRIKYSVVDEQFVATYILYGDVIL